VPILTEQERCGTDLAGKYRIESILGRGGMGVVFRARHLHTQRPVAIKILRPEFSQDHSLSKRFIREARAASSIRHPNVVAVFDLGIDEDSTIYQVLELLDGEPLNDHLDRKGALAPERALELLLPVMGALVLAHQQGIVHRDLKPDNIFLARNHDGRVTPTLLDFGIAKLVDHAGSHATRTGSVMGTPHYMAPEQARGAKGQGVGIDIWAMGILTFQCLTGHVPFDGSTPALVMLQIMTERAPRLDVVDPALPSGIATVVEKALMPSTTDRYASMAEFVDALREAATEAGLHLPNARESTAGPISARPPRPHIDGHAETEVHADERPDAREVAAARAEMKQHDSLSETVAAKSSAASGVASVAVQDTGGTPVLDALEPARGTSKATARAAVAIVAGIALLGLGGFALSSARGGASVAPVATAPPQASQARTASPTTPPVAPTITPEPTVAQAPTADGDAGTPTPQGLDLPEGRRGSSALELRGAVRGHGMAHTRTRPDPEVSAADHAPPSMANDAPEGTTMQQAGPSNSLPGVVEW